MRSLLAIILAVAVAAVAMGGTVTVRKDGTADAASVQVAIAMANNGDTILIEDSATYEEDLTAGEMAGLVKEFTLKAADGQTPVISSVNEMERIEGLGIPGTDYMGTFFFGCQGLLIEGITFENLSTNGNAAEISGVLSLFDCSDVVIRNCTIRAAGGRSGLSRR